MELSLILLNKLAVMFLFMGIGLILYKTKKITMQGNKELATILIYVILPSTILSSFITEFTYEKLIGLIISFLAAAAALLISILISRLVFGNRYKIEHFGTAFSNAGFMGIPLVKAVADGLGCTENTAVFYLTSFVALLNILQWTYGVYIMSGNKDVISPKKIVTNPVVIAGVIGLLLFVTSIPVPLILTDSLAMVGNMTAPVAMITLGVYLAETPFFDIFRSKSAYVSALVRLLLIPAVTMILLSFLPTEFNSIKMIVLIAASAPVGSNVAIFAQLNHLNYSQAVKIICLSTILCIITMPVMIAVAGLIWN
ncbi:MAG: AEC family transporter [Lachnospiraceae bacterium]